MFHPIANATESILKEGKRWKTWFLVYEVTKSVFFLKKSYEISPLKISTLEP